MIERAANAINSNRFFSEFAPCPQDLRETTSGFFGEGTPEQIELQRKQKENIINHGYSDWYSWSNANWGTKWEACEPYSVKHSDTFIFVSFDTAWSPPIPFYEKLKDLGFTVKGYYYEGGCSYCGLWDDGDDDYHDINGKSDWVTENIPSDIDLMFCISENMAIWEEEENA
jgi:hypothetical protein